MEPNVEISDDALKILVAEHGVRGTARLLGLSETQTHTFRKRVTRGKWLDDPALETVKQRTQISPQSVAKPIVSTMSPNQALAQEISQLGGESRLSLARGIRRAAQTVEALTGNEILNRSGDVKAITQTADLVHGWKESAPNVKIRLDVLSGADSHPVIDVETFVSDWESESCDVDAY